MAKQKLYRSQIARAPIDQRCLGAAQGMGAVRVWIKPNGDKPLRQKARILAGGHAPPWAASTEQVFARVPAGVRQIFVNGLPGLFGELKPDGPAGLSLSYGGSLDRMAVRSNIVDADGNKVTAAQLAVDG